MSTVDEFERDDGREKAHKDWQAHAQDPNWHPLYKQHPVKKSRALQWINDRYVDIGLMSENPCADGYIHQIWEEEKELQEALKRQNYNVVEFEPLPSDSAVKIPAQPELLSKALTDWSSAGRLPYPEHLSEELDDWHDYETIRDGYLDAQKHRKEGKPCAYQKGKNGQILERKPGESQFTPSKQLPLYVKGYLLGYSGKVATLKNDLCISVQNDKLTPQLDDSVVARSMGTFDGVQARKTYGALSGIKPPYVFKNKRLYARVRVGVGHTEYQQITDEAQFAYAVAFLKSWKSWEKKNPPMKPYQPQKPKAVKKARQLRLKLEQNEHD